MKPNRTNRSRAYYRHHRQRVIRRKVKIIEQKDCWNYRYAGMLSKGKIHCSCQMCAIKTKVYGFPHSERKQMERGNQFLQR